MKKNGTKKPRTEITTLGRNPEAHYGAVNPPVYRASTLLFNTLDDYEAGEKGTYHQSTYGRYGTPTSQALEEAVAALEGADHAIVMASGVAAFTASLLAFLNAGDHLLVTDSVYGPCRRFCDQELSRLGVEVTYYNPRISSGIASLIKPNTKVVYCESPGSLTFEIQDIPAICAAAHTKGAIVMIDNTWATPLFFKPFEHGVDVVIHSATKYISGHSDLIMGIVTTTKTHYPTLLKTYKNTGACPAPDNCFLALRGLRTMEVRLARHQESAIILAEWLSTRPEVMKVLHPALPSHPDHALWKRDFTGASGLFSILVKPYKREGLAYMLDHMELFGMGYSWGGFESLMIPFKPAAIRTAMQWTHSGLCLRLHAGLEDTDDLIADLDAGFVRLNERG